MSDIMRPIPFAQLMDWALTEYKERGSLFGVSKLVRHENGQALPIFAEKIEAPYGPAAGPNTQLAQNIIASYAAGARFFELKTVQIMDGEELSKRVAKPCITAGDECYNCEWSTELTVPQAYDEYVKAWFACKLLAKELELGNPDAFKLPRPHVAGSPYDFSFSGLKTAVINIVHNAHQKGKKVSVNDLSASFQAAVCDIISEKLMAALAETGHKKLVLAGGVSANSGLRARLEADCEERGVQFYCPPLALCGDNAAMVGSQGYYEFLAGNIAGSDLNAVASKKIDIE